MINHLNHEILKFDMSMSNHLHRYHLLAAIRQLFPPCNHRAVIGEPTRLSDLRERYIKYDHCQKKLASQWLGQRTDLQKKSAAILNSAKAF